MKIITIMALFVMSCATGQCKDIAFLISLTGNDIKSNQFAVYKLGENGDVQLAYSEHFGPAELVNEFETLFFCN